MAKADNVHSTPPPRSTTDPIFAAIERHRNAARNVRDALEQVVGARLPMIDAGLDLIKTAPTTVEGIVAALEFMRDQLQGDADTMPIRWLDVFVDTLCDAAAALLAQYPDPEDQSQRLT